MHPFPQPLRRPLVAAALLAAGAAPAQSQVTLYGLASTAVRYTHNIDAQHHHKSELVGSGIGGSRIGLRGQEDLGSGNKAVFTLEHGVAMDSGASANAATFWDRQAFVGLQGDWGQLSLGRQYNALNNVAWEFNPLDQTWGIFWSDPVYLGGDVFYQGYRIDNSVVYQQQIGPVKLQLDYGFGEQPGSARRGQTLGAGALYRDGALALGVAYDQQRSASGAGTERTYALAGSYAFGATTAYAGYLAHRESASHARQDIAYVGLGRQLTPALHLSGAWYHYRQNRNVTTQYQATPLLLGSGRANALAAVLDYALSKRTSLYLSLDTVRLHDGAVGRETEYWAGAAATGVHRSTRIGTMAGIRHSF